MVNSATLNALYWFNWRAISDAGHRMYGRHIFEAFLPLVADGHRELTHIFDGDVLGNGLVPILTTGTEEAHDAGKIVSTNSNELFIVAVSTNGPLDIEGIHRQLKNVTGYLGKTSNRLIPFEQFYAITEEISLVYSLSLKDQYVKLMDFSHLRPEAIESMGLTVVN